MGNHIQLPPFDTLVALYRDDPEAFECFRARLFQDVVDSSPEEHRPALRLLLQRIEEERSKAKTPMDGLIISMRMMRESLQQLRKGWQDAHYAVAGLQTKILIESARRRED